MSGALSNGASTAVPVGSGMPTDWLHPPGTPAPGAPKGLVDLFVSPASTTADVQHAGLASISPWWFALLVGVLLTAALLFLMWRYRRPLLLRWRLWRLARLLGRGTAERPSIERLAEALMWSLWRYFLPGEMGVIAGRPGLDRRTVPSRWRAAIIRLDVVRYAGPSVEGSDEQRLTAFAEVLQDIRRLPMRRVESLQAPRAPRSPPLSREASA